LTAFRRILPLLFGNVANAIENMIYSGVHELFAVGFGLAKFGFEFIAE
jgi:hypothetical protein